MERKGAAGGIVWREKRGLAWFAACDGKPTERRENRVLASLGWKDRGESSSGRRLPAASLPALLCLRWVREEQQLLVCSVERSSEEKSSVACGGKKIRVAGVLCCCCCLVDFCPRQRGSESERAADRERMRESERENERE